MLESVANFFDVPLFIITGLLAGLMVGILSSYYGSFVVQRGLSFLGNGLAHAAFGGVALGILLNTEPLYVAAPFTVAIALGIVWLQQNTRLGADTSIGILFSVSMALGIIFLSLTDRFSTDASSYLFGSILAVRVEDLYVTGIVILGSACTIPIWGKWAYATFDRELARSDRVPCLGQDYLMAACLAVTTVVSMKVVGIVLIAAFLVIPPAAARLLTRTFSAMTVLSMILGTVSVLIGLVISWRLDLPPGAAIIMVQASIFAIAVILKR